MIKCHARIWVDVPAPFSRETRKRRPWDGFHRSTMSHGSMLLKTVLPRADHARADKTARTLVGEPFF